MPDKLRILLLEDSETDAELIARELSKSGFEFDKRLAQSKESFIAELETFRPHVILSDHNLPQFNSTEALKLAKDFEKKSKFCTAFILVTGSVSEEFAVQCIKDGADDYILKDRVTRLPSAIESAIAKKRMENERNWFLEKILESEAMLKEAEQIGQIGSWQANARSEHIQWSDHIYRIYGYEPGEVEPSLDLIQKHIHPDDLPAFQKHMSQVLQKENSFESELRIIVKGGVEKIVFFKILADRDDEGQLIRLFGFSQDITARKKTEMEFQKNQQEYFSLFEQNPDGVYSINRDGKFLGVNESLATMLDTTVVELTSMEFMPFIEEEYLPSVMDNFAKALEGIPNRLDFAVRTKTGRQIFVSATTMPIVVNDRIIGVHGVVKDITENLKQAHAIKEQNKKLREIAWEQSHLVRAPLSTMMGLIDLMDKLNEEEISRQELLQHIMVSANELDSIIRNIVKKTEEINVGT